MRSGGWNKSKKSINVDGSNIYSWRMDFFSKISKCDFMIIREMKVH